MKLNSTIVGCTIGVVLQIALFRVPEIGEKSVKV